MVRPQKKNRTAAILKKLPLMMFDTVFGKMFIHRDEEAQEPFLPFMEERSSIMFDDVFRKVRIVIHDMTDFFGIFRTDDTDGIVQFDRGPWNHGT